MVLSCVRGGRVPLLFALPRSATRSLQRRRIRPRVAGWWTLSVCELVCAPKIARTVDTVCQVASVFIQCEDSNLTYRGCSICKKAWPEDGAQPCSCAEAAQTNYWRCHLTLTDHTGQVKATCFDAFESVAMFADECARPDKYVDEPLDRSCCLALPRCLSRFDSALRTIHSLRGQSRLSASSRRRSMAIRV